MMKKALLPIFLFLAKITLAQPILEASDFSTQYSAIGYNANTAGYTNGSGGVDQLWDYSTITLVPNNLLISLNPKDSEWLESIFTMANYFYKWDTNGYIYYDTYALNNTSLERTGYIDWDLIDLYGDTEVVFQFPYTYNTTFEDDNSGFATPITRTYDAYGILLTPFGTFTDVIRQKIEKGSQVTYAWIDSHNGQKILSGNFNSFQVYFYKDVTNLATSQYPSQAFSIYPNPVHSDFTVSYGNNFNSDYFMSVYDVLGKALIVNEKLSKDFTNISFNDFSPGLYIVKITDAQKKVLHTEKIIKQ